MEDEASPSHQLARLHRSSGFAGKWPYFALKPEETTVAFFEVGLGEPLTAKPLRLVATSAPKELDYTLLELDVVPDGVLPTLNTAPIASPGRVNILGHPLGGEMTVSIQDNEIREFEGSYIRYVTPTREGSSGSPVFDQSWNVVALHHAGIASRKTNEGILMAPILEHVKAKI